MLAFLPWIFIAPLWHLFQEYAFLGLLAITMIVPRLFRKFSRSMERRADKAATANEGDAGTYARALAQLYQDNLVPAVGARPTHPHLYDRMLAAGVAPDFPRPAPARRMGLNGYFFIILLAVVIACLVMPNLFPLGK